MESDHDSLHRGLGAYALRQARRRDRGKPDRAGRRRSAGRRRHRAPRTSTRSCSATSTPASRRRILPPRWCCRLRPICASSARPRVENACATGSAAVHQGLKSIAARRARIVLVVGVEQMTTTPGPEIGRNLLKASYVREEADIDGGFAGIFGKIAEALFPALGRSVGRARPDRGEEPQERRRQSLRADAQGSRLRVLPPREREESARRRSAQAHRLLAGLRRRRGRGAGRRRDRA